MIGSRFLLWIDGVGGYLVCLANKVSLGRAQPGTAVDVPLLADVSRVHAHLARDPEGYVIEAQRPVSVNNQLLERGLLRDQDRVTLGSSFQFLFRLPVPVSSSARLEIVSGHRLALAVEAVLLMGDTLVLSAGSQSHVQVPELKRQFVLCRTKEGLGVRHAGAFRVNDRQCTERAELQLPATVSADDITFSLECAV